MLLSLQTVVEVAKLLGVESPLQPVLSFPLGANDVTLQDLAMLYQSLATGQVFGDSTSPKNHWSLIQRIENTGGRTIYEADHQSRNILDPGVNRALQEIMRSVVEYGTGRRAKRFLQTEYAREDGKQVTVQIPALGKTGTANNYSNATFVGHLPVPTRQGMQTRGGYTIAVYVGSDRPGEAEATANRFRLTGSSGALPVWSRIAYYLIQTREYQERLSIYHPNLKSFEGKLLLSYATSPPLNVNDKNGCWRRCHGAQRRSLLTTTHSNYPEKFHCFLACWKGDHRLQRRVSGRRKMDYRNEAATIDGQHE